MNKYLYCFLTYIPSAICPGVVSLHRMVVLYLVFWGTFILLSIVVALIYIPTNSVEVFLFSHIFASICCVTDDSHSDWSEVESQCCFDLYFLHGLGSFGNPTTESKGRHFGHWIYQVFPPFPSKFLFLPTTISSSKNHRNKQGMMILAWNSSALEVDAGGSWVRGMPALHGENKQANRTNNIRKSQKLLFSSLI
jgi:hypothetical protein